MSEEFRVSHKQKFFCWFSILLEDSLEGRIPDDGDVSVWSHSLKRGVFIIPPAWCQLVQLISAFRSVVWVLKWGNKMNSLLSVCLIQINAILGAVSRPKWNYYKILYFPADCICIANLKEQQNVFWTTFLGVPFVQLQFVPATNYLSCAVAN